MKQRHVDMLISDIWNIFRCVNNQSCCSTSSSAAWIFTFCGYFVSLYIYLHFKTHPSLCSCCCAAPEIVWSWLNSQFFGWTVPLMSFKNSHFLVKLPSCLIFINSFFCSHRMNWAATDFNLVLQKITCPSQKKTLIVLILKSQYFSLKWIIHIYRPLYTFQQKPAIQREKSLNYSKLQS